jgi:RNA-directed DNA polymerase
MFFGLNTLGWKFYLNNFGKINCSISLDNIRFHKLKLKIILKSFSTISSSLFILRLLNIRIINWVNLFSISDDFFCRYVEMDIYTFIIFWKWVKRRHPRRPNTWIYKKYWKFFPFENKWFFFLINPFSGLCLFLKSHFKKTYKIYCLPSSISFYDFFSQNKFSLIWFKRVNEILEGIYNILWKKQFGKCFVCKKFFEYIDLNSIKINKNLFTSNGELAFNLLHLDCSFNFYI